MYWVRSLDLIFGKWVRFYFRTSFIFMIHLNTRVYVLVEILSYNLSFMVLYRVFHLVFTYFKWLCLCNLWYFNLCCKDQNWFEEWQFCLTKIGNFGDFDVWKIDCQNIPLFPNLLSWSSGKSQGWYAKGPWFKTWLWQVKNLYFC